MIRIIYSWKIAPDNLDHFIETWKHTTQQIHREVDGARGSFMIRSERDPCEIKTIARWDSVDHWKQFWDDSNHPMSTMHALGERTSVEIYQEVDDFTT